RGGYITKNRQIMLAVGGHDVLAPPYRQQVIFGHQARHAFAVHSPSLLFQVPAYTAIPITAAGGDDDLLDPSSQFHGPHPWSPTPRPPSLVSPPFPVAIKPGPADPRSPTHPLDTEVFLRLLYASDFFVDAVSPPPLLARRRASILRKAPCKKSTSSTFLPSASRSC